MAKSAMNDLSEYAATHGTIPPLRARSSASTTKPSATLLSPSDTASATKIQPIGLSGNLDATSAPTTADTKKIAIAIPSVAAKCWGSSSPWTTSLTPVPITPTAMLTPTSGQAILDAVCLVTSRPGSAATARRAPAGSSRRRRRAAPAERRQVDLVAQPRAERIERPLRVVAATVEAPVDYPLDARAQRQEERRHDSVETAMARSDPPPPTRTGRPASTRPTYVAPRITVSEP